MKRHIEPRFSNSEAKLVEVLIDVFVDAQGENEGRTFQNRRDLSLARSALLKLRLARKRANARGSSRSNHR